MEAYDQLLPLQNIVDFARRMRDFELTPTRLQSLRSFAVKSIVNLVPLALIIKLFMSLEIRYYVLESPLNLIYANFALMSLIVLLASFIVDLRNAVRHQTLPLMRGISKVTPIFALLAIIIKVIVYVFKQQTA